MKVCDICKNDFEVIEIGDNNTGSIMICSTCYDKSDYEKIKHIRKTKPNYPFDDETKKFIEEVVKKERGMIN